MKKIVIILFIALLCIGCSDSSSYVIKEDIDKINEHEVIATVINSLKGQDYKALSQMFDVDTGNLKDLQYDKTMEVVFEATNYRLESIEETDTEINAVLNINMPFSKELSNVATFITLKKTSNSDGTPNFNLKPGESVKIWSNAFIKQVKSQKGARIVYNYEITLVKVNDKWIIKNDPVEFIGIFFGRYVEGYSDYWYQENSDYYDIWLGK